MSETALKCLNCPQTHVQTDGYPGKTCSFHFIVELNISRAACGELF